jgi:glycosyltransferase involved in cell wall biosynthesis
MQSYNVIRVFHCKHRIGKGGALKAAFNESRGDVVVFMDGDGGYRPSEIPLFLKTLETSSIAIGIRSPEK